MEEVTEARNIDQVVYGNYKFDTWYNGLGYFNPSRRLVKSGKALEPVFDGQPQTDSKQINTLYVCSWCFKYNQNEYKMKIHMSICQYRKEPPGIMVYKSPSHVIRKIEGRKDHLYCQCLSLFSKLYLDSKSIHFAVDGFEFYVISDPNSSNSNQVMGYFSKEKLSWDQNNLACILVFPPFQRLGLGKILIAYSYYLSRRQGIIGSPERPLSSFGQISYLSYWCKTIARLVLQWNQPFVSINELSNASSIDPLDVLEALQSMNALQEEIGPNGQVDKCICIDIIRAWAERHPKSLEPIINPHHCLIRKTSN